MRKIEILGELCLQLSVPKFQENPRHLLFNACSASVLRFSHENTWPWFKTEKISNKIAFLAIFTGKGISSTHSFVLLWSLHVLYFGYSLLPQFTVGKRVCYAWKQKQWFQPIWINYVNCSFFLLFSRQNKKKLLFVGRRRMCPFFVPVLCQNWSEDFISNWHLFCITYSPTLKSIQTSWLIHRFFLLKWIHPFKNDISG